MDSAKLTEYFKSYGDTVYRVAYSIIQNPAECEDITQDIFLKLYQSNRSFNSDEHAKAWLIRVAINKAKDYLRSHRHKHTEELSDISAQLDSNENSDLAYALEALDEKYRIAIYLHYYEGYGVRDMAKLLGITESNAKTRLKRAREKLKAYLNNDT